MSDLTELPDQECFGLKVGQQVRIIEGGVFHGQETEILAFTATTIIVEVAGPPGEPESEWWFPPESLEPLDNFLST